MTFVHELHTDAGHPCLTLHGDIDLAAREELHAVLLRAVGMSRAGTEVDLRDVTFLDCAGIGALVAANNAARSQGRCVTVTHPRGIAYLALELTGVLSHLTAPSPRRRQGTLDT